MFCQNGILSFGGKKYSFAPKKDITAHELAECVSVLFMAQTVMSAAKIQVAADALSKGAKKHFHEITAEKPTPEPEPSV